jgi:hypothetical protein
MRMKELFTDLTSAFLLFTIKDKTVYGKKGFKVRRRYQTSVERLQ